MTIQDKSEKCLTDEPEKLNRWTEYCSYLSNYAADWDPTDPQILPILLEEVEAAVEELRMGKSAGDQSDVLVKAGGDAMIHVIPQSSTKSCGRSSYPPSYMHVKAGP